MQEGWCYQMARHNDSLEARLRAEEDAHDLSRERAEQERSKVVRLAEHTEKLMSHLKHESAAKSKAEKDGEIREAECKRLRAECKRTEKRIRKLTAQANTVREGAKVLEMQLKMLDKRYIDLRQKCDYTKKSSDKEFVRVQSELNDAREAWATAQEAIREREEEARAKEEARRNANIARREQAARRRARGGSRVNLGQVSPIKRGRGRVGTSFREPVPGPPPGPPPADAEDAATGGATAFNSSLLPSPVRARGRQARGGFRGAGSAAAARSAPHAPLARSQTTTDELGTLTKAPGDEDVDGGAGTTPKPPREAFAEGSFSPIKRRRAPR
jgi:hypothetical protein